MDIEISGYNLTLIKPLREISTKRSTYLAKLTTGELVIVKGFHAKSRKYYQKEILMHQRLADEFNVPKIISQTPSHTEFAGGVLVYEFIDNKSLTHYFSNRPIRGQRILMISRLINILKRLEAKKIAHHDPHLSNFLLKDDKIYLVDLSSLNIENAVDNVSTFLAQFPLNNYLELQILNSNQSNREKIKTIYLRRKQQFYKKIMRECSDIQFTVEGDHRLLWNKSITDIELDTSITEKLAYLSSKSKVQLKQNSLFSLISKNPFANNLQLVWQALHWLYLNQLSLIKPLAFSYQASTKMTTLWLDIPNKTLHTRFSLLRKEEIRYINNHLSKLGVIIDETR